MTEPGQIPASKGLGNLVHRIQHDLQSSFGSKKKIPNRSSELAVMQAWQAYCKHQPAERAKALQASTFKRLYPMRAAWRGMRVVVQAAHEAQAAACKIANWATSCRAFTNWRLAKVCLVHKSHIKPYGLICGMPPSIVGQGWESMNHVFSIEYYAETGYNVMFKRRRCTSYVDT